MSISLMLSVLSVEPYGMKRPDCLTKVVHIETFSALGRAVWDETSPLIHTHHSSLRLSVLSVEPYGMKHDPIPGGIAEQHLSVLSVEPYGMKHRIELRH